jgi:hypothetical protein
LIYAQAVAGVVAAEKAASEPWLRRVLVATVLALDVVLVLAPPAVALLALTGVLR